jgi:hypothetical protein
LEIDMSQQSLIERRQHTRAPSSQPVTITVDTEPDYGVYALTLDISPSGARLQTEAYLQEGQQITLTRNGTAAQKVPSQVVWARGPGNGHAREVGVAFLQGMKL